MLSSIQFILSQQIVEIILWAYVGALIGEYKKEVDDEYSVVFTKFLSAWISSGFGGVLVGVFLQGTFAKDNKYIVKCGAGAAGFLGYEVSLGLIKHYLTKLFSGNKKDKSD